MNYGTLTSSPCHLQNQQNSGSCLCTGTLMSAFATAGRCLLAPSVFGCQMVGVPTEGWGDPIPFPVLCCLWVPVESATPLATPQFPILPTLPGYLTPFSLPSPLTLPHPAIAGFAKREAHLFHLLHFFMSWCFPMPKLMSSWPGFSLTLATF